MFLKEDNKVEYSMLLALAVGLLRSWSLELCSS